MTYGEGDAEYFERRSRENLIEMFREELLMVIKGEKCMDLIPTGVRRRLRRDGVLTKHGSRYEVSSLGRKMLSKEA